MVSSCTCARASRARFSWREFGIRKAAQDLRKKKIDVGRGLLHGDAGFQPAQDVERFGKVLLVPAPAGRDDLGHG